MNIDRDIHKGWDRRQEQEMGMETDGGTIWTETKVETKRGRGQGWAYFNLSHLVTVLVRFPTLKKKVASRQ